MDEITNKVAGSGLITIDLEEFYPANERVVFDLTPHLFQGLVLREKDFREFVKTNSWELFRDKIVAITCSADAIVPTWAYMLTALALEPFASQIFFAKPEELDNLIFAEALAKINPEDYKDARVVIKGCSNKQVPLNAYVKLAALLKPYAKSILYGEPCSTVPLYKSKQAGSNT